MAFQVEPEPVGRRGSRASVVLVGVICVAIVGFALLTRVGTEADARPIAAASPDVVARDAAGTTPPASTPRPTPTPSDDPFGVDGLAFRYRPSVTIVCNDAGAAMCDRIATAASRHVIGRSSIREIQVWTSLLCRDLSDCPASRMAGTTRLGSAVVSFRSGLPDAWVNVVGPLPVQPRSPRDDVAWNIN